MRRLGAALASLFVRLRWLVIGAWIAGTVWIVVALPSIGGSEGNTLSTLVPSGTSALRAERISSTRFAFPLLTRTIVVVRDPHGLPLARQTELARLAVGLSTHKIAGFRQIAGALPLVNTFGTHPFVREHGTTALLYLYFEPAASPTSRTAIARRLVRRRIGRRAGEFVGVTGESPAQATETALLNERLELVELATLLLVALAVSINFRALGAGLLTVGAVIAAYLVSDHVIGYIAERGEMVIPAEMTPVLVVLVFGIVTDYSIFFTSRFRALLRAGVERRAAAQTIVRQVTPIVVAAGLTVAAGTASLTVAKLEFLHAFGPGLAIAVLIAMALASTLVPAALAVGGRRVFWPSRLTAADASGGTATGTQTGTDSEAQDAGPMPRRRSPSGLAARHPLLALGVSTMVIVGAASGLWFIALSDEMVRELPAGAEARQAFDQAGRGFTPGVLAPAAVVLTGPHVGESRAGLARVQTALRRQQGVAAVIGPRQQPFKRAHGVAIARDGNAARYLLFFDSDPLGPRAIAQAEAIESRMPALLKRAGLHDAKGLLAGDSALSAGLIGDTLGDLGRVTPTMLAAIFLVIAIFLRALVAPAYLIATSLLAALAGLGLTVYVMHDLLGYPALTYYVIFTVVVLLVSIGSDYNVFMVGRIWQEGRRRKLPDAVELGATRAARPISTAGLVLALAFALLAIVPLASFREIALAMAFGLLIDAFVVRVLLVPALLTLVGSGSAWPGRRL